MSDDVSEDRPQHRELRPLLFFVSICMVMFIPVVVFSSFLRIDGFLSSFFFCVVFKLID